jgi:putative addiction module CopG family antidote
MNLTLKPELTEFIQQEILTGKYASPDEAIEAALNLLKSKSATERLATELREKIDSTAAQLDREAWALPNNGKGLNPEDVLNGLRAKLRTENPWLAFSAWDNDDDDIYAQLH